MSVIISHPGPRGNGLLCGKSFSSEISLYLFAQAGPQKGLINLFSYFVSCMLSYQYIAFVKVFLQT